MTVPLIAPPNPSKGGDPATATASVRKRRRRAPAGGAADDCFTCSKRNVKCDRRRPYCSQCLEVGNECSGYKTQLTWGVGVASRGKLRGLSLPIAKAPPVQPVKKLSTARSRAGSSHQLPRWHGHGDVSPRHGHEDLDMPPDHLAVSMPTTPYATFEFSQMPHADTIPSIAQPQWPFPSSMPADGIRFPKLGPIMVPNGEHLSGSMDSISDAEFLSPLSHSFGRDDMPFVHSPTVLYESFTGHNSPMPPSPVSAIVIDARPVPTSCPGLVYTPSEPSSSLHSHTDNFDAHLSHRLMQDCDSLGAPDLDSYSTSAHSNGHYWGSSPDEETSSHGMSESTSGGWPPMADPQAMPLNPDLIAKMPFFMDYYEHTMCPSMVFIDGPNNPFREHILHLAVGSRSLQHAICALAACNLRMKRKLSLGQHAREMVDKSEDGLPDDQSLSEEYQHRNLAVHLLNEQLNDPTKSKQDSVLATILLLCHYRMAESGIAKFHTQFAGVKKLLSLRRSSPFPPSRDAAWMEALFTYFDAISASINDREAQLNTSFYGVLPDAQLLPPGAENLVGCDRELFKTVIKLGRLNVLSQHRPVQNLLSSSLSRGAVPNESSMGLGGKSGHHGHHLSADVFSASRFDTGVFSATIDEEEFMPSSTLSPPAYDDYRSTFWREWKDARIALQSWEFDPQRIVPSLPGQSPPTSAQVRDLASLSEAFRYAALLYTERLASPNVPCGHNNFRNLVSQVVYYATSLEAGSSAEKFLLWPLFVAGSECVNEMQQGIVRSKCRDIMTRSGYMNNLAALDVLERLWAGDWKDDGPSGKLGGSMMKKGPFNWTRCIGGPGIEVEWIMF